MSRSSFHPDPSVIDTGALVGSYRFTHDGWTGRLALESVEGHEVRGSYHDDRFDADYEVRGHVGENQPNQLELIILDFNWMTEQCFHGWIFTQGSPGFAGVTRWQGTPYGFFALRTRLLNLGAFERGRVELDDLVGRHRIVLDGVTAALEFDTVSGGATMGRCRFEPWQTDLSVRATLGDVRHAVRLTMSDPERPDRNLVIDGHLFTRDKNAIAGSLLWRGLRFGCYLIRLR